MDFFLISKSLTQYVTETTIHPIIISDHAPISITLHAQSCIKPPKRWHFNISLLLDSDFDNFIKKEWAFFLEMNDSPETSPSLLWETGKAVITGTNISYSSYRKKQQQQLENNLEQKIKHLTDINTTNPSEQIQGELKTELNNIINHKI